MNEKLTLAAREQRPPRSDADRRRLQRMFAVYHTTVWSLLRRHGLSPDAAADATQRAFLLAAERLAEIEPQGERAFLTASALEIAHACDPELQPVPHEQPSRGLSERMAVGIGIPAPVLLAAPAPAPVGPSSPSKLTRSARAALLWLVGVALAVAAAGAALSLLAR